MSADNYIGIWFNGRVYLVHESLSASNFNPDLMTRVQMEDRFRSCPSFEHRRAALEYAHDVDSHHETEYGVREIKWRGGRECKCAEIMEEDHTRHFRGCPMRELYPDHPMAQVCGGEFRWKEVDGGSGRGLQCWKCGMWSLAGAREGDPHKGPPGVREHLKSVEPREQTPFERDLELHRARIDNFFRKPPSSMTNATKEDVLSDAVRFLLAVAHPPGELKLEERLAALEVAIVAKVFETPSNFINRFDSVEKVIVEHEGRIAKVEAEVDIPIRRPMTPSEVKKALGHDQVWPLGTPEAQKALDEMLKNETQAAFDQMLKHTWPPHGVAEVSDEALLTLACDLLNGVLYDAPGTITFTDGPDKGETRPTPEARVLADEFKKIRDKVIKTAVRLAVPYKPDLPTMSFDAVGPLAPKVRDKPAPVRAFLEKEVDDGTWRIVLTGPKADLEEMWEAGVHKKLAFTSYGSIPHGPLELRLGPWELTQSTGAAMPKIVCLCGSTRFAKEFGDANLAETLKGNIVLTVGSMTHSDDELSHCTVCAKTGKREELMGDTCPGRRLKDGEGAVCSEPHRIARSLAPGVKGMLDALHKHKIDMADEVFVLNVLACKKCKIVMAPGGPHRFCTAEPGLRCEFEPYIGESTKSEIAHALSRGKPIRFLNNQLIDTAFWESIRLAPPYLDYRREMLPGDTMTYRAERK